MNLGHGYSLQKDTEKSIKHYQQALAIGKEIKDLRIVKFCQGELEAMK